MKSENLSSNANDELMEAEVMEDAAVDKILGEKRSGSSSPFSSMWMKTLYRRDMLLAFVAFMAYFTTTILPLILNFRNFGDVAEYYVSLLGSGITFTSVIPMTYPIVLSVLLFDYLHNSASAAAMHTFPVTRGKLYRSTLLTGAVLLLVPALITAIMMFICGLVMPSNGATYNYALQHTLTPAALFSAVNCMRWFIDTAVASLFVFAIANLAGIVAGKDIIHALLACLLNSIVGIVCLLIDTYANSFIAGSNGTNFTLFAQKSNPLLWFWTERNGMLSFEHVPMMLVFVAITAAIILFTGLLYRKIKLEREQDATVFPVVSDMLVIFCTFCIMSMFGLISAEIVPGEHATLPLLPFLFGCVAGGVPAFIVFRMIADSTVRIFNVRTLITFTAFCLITCAVFAFTCFDITDQASRVPDPSNVDRVTIHTMKPFNTDIKLMESRSVSDVTELHKALVSHKDDLTNSDYSSGTVNVVIEYKLNNGSKLSRSYYIDAYKLDDVRRAAATVAAGDEYQKKVENYLRKVVRNAESSYIYTSKGQADINKEDIHDLVAAYLKDYKANDPDYYYGLSVRNIPEDASLSFKENKMGILSVSPKLDGDGVGDDTLFMDVCFGKKDKNVQKFLEKHGYAEALENTEKDYDSATSEGGEIELG